MGTTTSGEAVGTLFIVATPIGNLEDITLRALRVLRDVQLIAAEDTRRTAHLLTRHGIATPTLSFHEHNTRERVPQLLGRLTRGESIALVSDAGMPGISDPGLELVQACLNAGIPVDPIPGPSAPLAAVVASGFPTTPLTILGFAPSRSKDRSRFIEDVSTIHSTVTFFEAPHRIARTLTEMSIILGDRQIVVARELTKVHQQFLRGTAATLATQLSEARGEITVVVGPVASAAVPASAPDDDEIAREFCQSTETTAKSRGERISETARRLGISRREVFAALERTKASGK